MAVGREVPLFRALEVTPETHGPRGMGYAELPEPREPLSERHATDLIVAEARRSGAHLPTTALIDQFYAEVQTMGGKRWDTSSLIALLDR